MAPVIARVLCEILTVYLFSSAGRYCDPSCVFVCLLIGWLVRSFISNRPRAALAGRRPAGGGQACGDIAVALQAPGGGLRPTSVSVFLLLLFNYLPLKAVNTTLPELFLACYPLCLVSIYTDSFTGH